MFRIRKSALNAPRESYIREIKNEVNLNCFYRGRPNGWTR